MATSGVLEVGASVRKLTPSERLFSWSPFSTVTVVVRILGRVSDETLRQAVSKVQLRHSNLRFRIVENERGDPWFAADAANESLIQVMSRLSDDHWISVVQDAATVPYEFGKRPPIRFILVRSPETSDLIISCHHIICDGLSLAYLARDLMMHLGDPSREVEVLPDPPLLAGDNLPAGIVVNGAVKFLINRMNKKWASQKVVFDQEDYECLSRAYWSCYRHELMPVELSVAQTASLVDQCRSEQVTVNTALTAAFVGAQVLVQGERPYHSEIAVAGSLRDRLRQPAGEAMGFYAAAVRLKFRYDVRRSFWENARRLHRKVVPLYTSKSLLKDALMWSYLDPTILEALNFKRIGALVPGTSPRYQKLTDFAARDDVVKSLLRREKMASLDTVAMGTAMTNLTRMDFPRTYGPLELDRLTMKPGGAFPLANVNLVVGAVTCCGKLSLALEFVESNIRMSEIGAIRDQALEFLLAD
jgi:hypothetical protein